MATISTENRRGRRLYRVNYRNEHKQRKQIRLQGVAKKDAQEIARKIDAIVSCRIAGTSLSPTVAEWIAELGGELHAKLANAGLFPPRQTATLQEFIDTFIAERKASSGERTVINWRAAQSKLIEYFGGDRDMRSVTAAEAQAWRRHLASQYAQATVSAHIKRAKQFFKEAVSKGVFSVSPFANVVAGDDSNAARQHFVSQANAETLIDTATSTEWRLMIALARYGGLRTPSETLRLKWSDIDWEAGTLRVESPKTKKHGRPFRLVPIFAELRPYLLEAAEAAEPGAVYCIQRYRSNKTNLRTGLERLIKRAGLEQWPRLWHNLRASRATELADIFPSHVAAQWLGHTEKVADKNYRMAHADHVRAAVESGTRGGDATARNGWKAVPPRAPLLQPFSGGAGFSGRFSPPPVPRRGVEPLSPP